MARLTIEDLASMREKATAKKSSAEAAPSCRILIGMGTCGIAAGAQDTFDAFHEELQSAGITGAVITKTGCIGQCYSEPTVEIRKTGMPDIIYGNVDRETAVKIVRKHIIEGSLIDDHIFDKPSSDIMDMAR